MVRELLSSADAGTSGLSGVRCAGADDRGSVAGADWGFPLYHNYGFPF